jgi:hypothetical protein
MGTSSSAARRIDFGGDTCSSCRYSAVEFLDVDTSGTNGSGAIVQVVDTGAGDSGTSNSATLAALGSANNAGYGWLDHQANEAIAAGIANELHDVAGTSPACGAQSQWEINQTLIDWSWATSVANGGLAVEIKAAAAGPIEVDLTNASETDTAQALSVTKTIFKSLAETTETDIAVALVVTKPIVKALTPASTTDSAQALGDVDKAVNLVTATETDTAQALRVPRLIQAAETNVAVALDVDKAVTLGMASETDSAQTLRVPRLTAAVETDSAQALTFSQSGAHDIAPALETDSAQALAFTKTIFKSLTTAAETDTAQALTFAQASDFDITQASETDTAQPLTVTKTIFMTLIPATESDLATAIELGGGVPMVGHFDPPSPNSQDFALEQLLAARFDPPTPEAVVV